MATLTVACVEVGDFLGRGVEYVEMLARMCRRHLPEHRFVVLSDHVRTLTAGIDYIIDSEMPASYWAKVHLFRPGRFDGPVIYFDLDVIIRRDVSGLLALLDVGNFWALDDFAWPLSRAADLEWLERIGQLRNSLRIRSDDQGNEAVDFAEMKATLSGMWGTCNSSVMLWRGDAGRAIWDRYTPEAAKGLHGDQNWITQVMGHKLHLIPPGWAGSYRYGPEGCPITVYHGEPKPHEVHDPDWR